MRFEPVEGFNKTPGDNQILIAQRKCNCYDILIFSKKKSFLISFRDILNHNIDTVDDSW